jgi:UDP-N-acetyl-D-mannosaminuronic acid transferase (WecB/TagA/CpsF family)
MRRNATRINELRCDLINEIKDFINKQNAERLTFTTTFNIGVDTIEFDDDYQKIMRTAEYITNDGFVIDEEATEIGLDELDTIELGFILDELEENKFEIF